MIQFIGRWHRFGGGSARDIFVEFGLAEHEFFRRTLELLQTGRFTGMNEETAEYPQGVGGGSRPLVLDDAVFASPTSCFTCPPADLIERTSRRRTPPR